MIRTRPPIQYKKMAEEKKKAIERGNDVVSVKFDKEGKDRAMLEKCKPMLVLDRDSTALKELAYIGSEVLLHSQISVIIPKIVARVKKGIYDSVILNQEQMAKK